MEDVQRSCEAGPPEDSVSSTVDANLAQNIQKLSNTLELVRSNLVDFEEYLSEIRHHVLTAGSKCVLDLQQVRDSVELYSPVADKMLRDSSAFERQGYNLMAKLYDRS